MQPASLSWVPELVCGHWRGVSEAPRLNQRLAGDPGAGGLERMKVSVTLKRRKGKGRARGAGRRTACQQRKTNRVCQTTNAGEKDIPVGVKKESGV